MEIDTKAMYSAAKGKAENLAPKEINETTLFNYLQDMRHILLLDVRSKEEYDAAHIRSSVHVSVPDFTKAQLLEEMDSTSKTFAEYNPKEGDKLRRLLIVTQGPLDPANPVMKDLIEKINSARAVTQLLQLKGGIYQFKTKYPYLMVSKDSPMEVQGLAASRFPSIVSEGKLYLGNFLNACAGKQLDLMGIKTLIGITPQPLTNIDPRFNYMHFPFMENLGDKQIFLFDFEGIISVISEAIGKGERVMVFSMNGQGSAAAVIAYLMRTNKWPVTVASSYVMKMRTETHDFNKDLFLQLNKWSCKDPPK